MKLETGNYTENYTDLLVTTRVRSDLTSRAGWWADKLFIVTRAAIALDPC